MDRREFLRTGCGVLLAGASCSYAGYLLTASSAYRVRSEGPGSKQRYGMVIDIFPHLISERVLSFLRSRKEFRFKPAPDNADIDARLALMDRFGIDIQAVIIKQNEQLLDVSKLLKCYIPYVLVLFTLHRYKCLNRYQF